MTRTPRYDPTVNFEVTPPADQTSSIDSMISEFQSFNNTGTNLGLDVLNKQNQQDKLAMRYKVSQTYQQFAQEAIDNPNKTNALQQYKYKSQLYSDQLTKSAGMFNKGYVSALTSYYAQANVKPLIKSALTQTQAIAKVNGIQQLNQSAIDMDKAFANIDPHAGNVELLPDYNQKLKSLQNLHQNNKLSDQEFSTQKQALLDEFTNNKLDIQTTAARSALHNIKENTIKMFEQGTLKASEVEPTIKIYQQKFLDNYLDVAYKQALASGKGDTFVKDMLNRFSPQMPQLQVEQAIGKVISLHTKLAQTEGLNKVSVGAAFNESLKNITENGAVPNVEAMNNFTSLHPGTEAWVNHKVAVAQSKHAISQMVYNGQYPQAQQLLNEKRVTNPNAKGAPLQNDIYDAQSQALLTAVQKLNEDPMKIIQTRTDGQELLANNQIQMSATPDEQYPNSPISSIKNYDWNKVENMQILSHVKNVRFLTNDTASQSVAYVHNATPTNQVRFFQQLNEKFPNTDHYEKVISQLAANGMSSDLQWMALMSPDTNNLPIVQLGLSTPTASLKAALYDTTNDKTAWSDARARVAKSIFNDDATGSFANFLNTFKSLPGGRDTKYLENLQSAVLKVATQLYISGRATSMDDGITKAENTFGNNSQYITFFNQTLALPKNVNSTAVTANLVKYTKTLITNFPFAKVQRYSGSLNRMLTEEDRKNQIMQGHWVNSAGSQTLIWANKDGYIPQSKDGKPLEININDLNNGHFPQTAQAKLDENNKIVNHGFIGLLQTINDTLKKQDKLQFPARDLGSDRFKAGLP